MPVIPAFLRVLKGLAIRSIQFCFLRLPLRSSTPDTHLCFPPEVMPVIPVFLCALEANGNSLRSHSVCSEPLLCDEESCCV